MYSYNFVPPPSGYHVSNFSPYPQTVSKHQPQAESHPPAPPTIYAPSIAKRAATLAETDFLIAVATNPGNFGLAEALGLGKNAQEAKRLREELLASLKKPAQNENEQQWRERLANETRERGQGVMNGAGIGGRMDKDVKEMSLDELQAKIEEASREMKRRAEYWATV